jgi:hypothetical protein
MSDQKPFIWAQGEEANVKEPIQALRENGWRYGDVPAASNFNWLFKMMTEEMASLRKDLISHKEEFAEALKNQVQSCENRLNAKVGRLDTKMSIRTDKLFVASDFNEGISRQICMLLRQLEKVLKVYHANFPTLPWPLHDPTVHETASANNVPSE